MQYSSQKKKITSQCFKFLQSCSPNCKVSGPTHTNTSHTWGWGPHLESDLTHLLHPLGSGLLLSSKDMSLVVGLHTEGGHVFFGTGLSDGWQDADALSQPDYLLVQLLGVGFLTGITAVEELQPCDSILAGRIQHKPVLFPFLKERWRERDVQMSHFKHRT